jgi:hypothetical protein
MTTQRATRHHRTLKSVTFAFCHGASTRKRIGRHGPDPRPLPSPTPHLTADQYARLLTAIDDAGGVSTIDGISRGLPQVTQPVSAVFDLCDAGILNVDWEAAFDGDMHVWRIDD